MKDKNEELVPDEQDCASSYLKMSWIVGIVLIGITVIFSIALVKPKESALPPPDPAIQNVAYSQAYVDPLLNPNSVPQQFPRPFLSQPSINVASPVDFGFQGGPVCPLPGPHQGVICPFCSNSFSAPNIANGVYSCPFCYRNLNDSAISSGSIANSNIANIFSPPQAQAVQPAVFSAGCAANPTAANCFPNMPMQQVAFAPGCATNPTAANCFPSAPMQQVAFAPGCGGNASAANCFPYGNVQRIALTKPLKAAPPIFRDAVMPHAYRGVCSNCHIIKPDVPIPSNAKMPHEYRGVCSNCHRILGTSAGAAVM